MPLFEYVCRKCGVQFESLIIGAKKPVCPSCGSTELEQAFSSFATSSGQKGSGVSASPAGGGCGHGHGSGGG
jgi:putative FmdB family regulatory protein